MRMLLSQRFGMLVVAAALLHSCGTSQESGRKRSEGEWVGVVTIDLLNPTTNASGMRAQSLPILTVDSTERYILLNERNATFVGIKGDSNSIVWDLGKRYRVAGRLVTDETELSVARDYGFAKVIRARLIELLDAPSP